MTQYTEYPTVNIAGTTAWERSGVRFFASSNTRMIAFDHGSGFYVYDGNRLVPTTPLPLDTLNLVPEYPTTLRKLETQIAAQGMWRYKNVLRGMLTTFLPVEPKYRYQFSPEFLEFFDRNQATLIQFMAQPNAKRIILHAYYQQHRVVQTASQLRYCPILTIDNCTNSWYT